MIESERNKRTETKEPHVYRRRMKSGRESTGKQATIPGSKTDSVIFEQISLTKYGIKRFSGQNEFPAKTIFQPDQRYLKKDFHLNQRFRPGQITS